MKKIIFSFLLISGVILIAFNSSADSTPLATHSGTCTGSKNCKACKSCTACKHCKKDGGTCGVCSK